MNSATATAPKMTTSAIRVRAMSADVSAPREALQIEAAFLADIIDGHTDALDSLYNSEMDAELRGDRNAQRILRVAIEAAKEDDRAYWAGSRMLDIRRRLGAGHTPQLTLGIN